MKSTHALLLLFMLPKLATAAAFSYELTLSCPKGLALRADSLCHYDLPYIGTKGQGLKTGFKPSKPALEPKKIQLGKLLFFDPILSGQMDMSCASCHHPQKGFSDGKAQSIGFDGKHLNRSAPTLWNTAFKKSWFWDGRAVTLEEQVLGPMLSEDEMGGEESQIIERLSSNRTYSRLFRDTFDTDKLTLQMVAEAIAEFERTLVSFNSAYDRYALGDEKALNQVELRGFNVFRSFVARCTECHTPPLFTNHQVAVIGVNDLPGVRDLGLGGLTGDSKQDFAFVVPTLRNITDSAPYMHNGTLKTLENVVEFYNEGGGRGSAGQSVERMHWHIRPMGLTKAEITAVAQFLGTLTDNSNTPTTPASVPSGLPVLKRRIYETK